MKSKAAVTWEAGKPLVIEEIDVDGPKAGEVLIRMVPVTLDGEYYPLPYTGEVAWGLGKPLKSITHP